MERYDCFLVERLENETIFELAQRELPGLSDGHVQVRLEYSSLNYKDALCASGHPGVALVSPLVPGIDAVGEIIGSASPQFSIGQKVILAHEHFGTKHDGGWAQYATVPSDWAIPLPKVLATVQAMTWGTAGFTAAQSVLALQSNSIEPADGPIVVTGASGGVGVCSVMLLHKLGYQVVAVSGKSSRHAWLMDLGANDVIDRNEFLDGSEKPMLAARFAGAVDTVGGQTLVTVIKSIHRGGCVAACGNVGGVDLPLTVFPFILRGLTLQGIDSAGASNEDRREIWNRIATDWALPDLALRKEVVELSDVSPAVKRILAGDVCGRIVVKISHDQ